MPFLNWAQREIQTGHEWSDQKLTLKLVLPAAVAAELPPALAGVQSGADRELRVDLPGKWSIFFKLREGQSRLLVAHPEENVFVSTLALTPELMAHFTSHILTQGVHQLGFADEGDSVSNLKVEWQVR